MRPAAKRAAAVYVAGSAVSRDGERAERTPFLLVRPVDIICPACKNCTVCGKGPRKRMQMSSSSEEPSPTDRTHSGGGRCESGDAGGSAIAALPGDLTRVLNSVGEDERKGLAAWLPIVYDDLRRLADSFFGRERTDHTLQPTALVHEAYVRLARSAGGGWKNREHFFRAAGVVMRHILVNHARDRARLKRGGEQERVPLDDALAAFEDRAVDLVALDEALEKLAEIDLRQCQIVELRFFAGLSVAETAEVLGVSKRTVEEDWMLARAWLLREITR